VFHVQQYLGDLCSETWVTERLAQRTDILRSNFLRYNRIRNTVKKCVEPNRIIHTNDLTI
jgi:hypothetical protein